MNSEPRERGELVDLQVSQKKYSKGYLLICCFLALSVGISLGFVGGVASTKAGASFLTDMFTMERAAETGKAKTLKRPRFQLKYPGNWKVDKADEDYDADLNFSIDSPGSAFTKFIIGSGDLDPKDNVENQREAFLKYMPKMTTKTLKGFGPYAGAGMEMKGRFIGIPTTVCAYSFRHEGLTFIIVTQCPDEDLGMVGPGFKQIEDSIEIKKAK